jgi:hypothetical protein
MDTSNFGKRGITVKLIDFEKYHIEIIATYR